MGDQATAPSGPDLTLGIAADTLLDGTMITGHVGDEAVLLARVGGELLATGAVCTHYSGPLGEGLLVGDTVRCPWHHACFSLRTGRAVRPPALNDLGRWQVEVESDRIYVRKKLPASRIRHPGRGGAARSIVILGAGAAGSTAAETLRKEGFDGRITLIDPDSDAPYDRPNISKDYLAGTAPEDWLPLHPRSYYTELEINLLLGRRAQAIDPAGRRLTLADGTTLPYDQLLLATGATPVELNIPGAPGRILYLRSLADSRRIIEAAKSARRAVVIGTSFIGLEVAASLRARGLEVHAVGPDPLPLGRVLGPALGEFIRDLHQEHGVVFHPEHTVRELQADVVVLDDGTRLPAELVVAGVGVRPNVELARQAGLAVDQGILVDEWLETSGSAIFAAGDVARWIDFRTGERVRVEHWVVAERMGQAAARNLLGRREAFDAVPFFWSQHYDVPISYVGQGTGWDGAVVDGDPAARDCAVTYYRDDRVIATATIFRDRQSLEAEVALEQSPVHR
ncbi:MAG TPA: FAD-dependent oxidoreductase [Gemmatimonadales bacterium]|nr:FAD-dependent oxidoreductase [Gemmatimonadales bacterium]